MKTAETEYYRLHLDISKKKKELEKKGITLNT